MKKIIFFVVVVIITFTALAFDIPAKPNPPKLVNDYIGLLQADQVQYLETKLVDFNNTTSIQITIVILDDLDGAEAYDIAVNIGEKWGVGQKEIDNGIVFLIVKYNQNAIEKLFTQKHGDWYIASGYGLEPYLTDYDAKHIGESNFIPHAKNNEYYQGIHQTIDALISNLGEVGWQQRQEMEAKKKAERAQDLEYFTNGLLIGAILLISIILLSWLYGRYLKFKKRKKRKVLLKTTFDEQKELYQQLLQQIDLDTDLYPVWAIEKHNDLLHQIDRCITIPVQKVIEEFPMSMETNMVRASQILRIITNTLPTLEILIDEIEMIPGEIQKYDDEASEKFTSLQKSLEEFSIFIQVEKDKGFFFIDQQAVLENFKKEMIAIKKKLDAHENKQVWEECTKKTQELNTAIEDLKAYVFIPKSVDTLIQDITLQICLLPAQKEAAKKELDEIKANNPKQNWEDLDTRFGSVTALLSLCEGKKEEAEIRNGMDIQDFTTAKKFVDEANEKMQKILNIFQDIHNRKVEILQAKDQYLNLLVQTEKKLSEAKVKVTHSDVKTETKNMYTVAIEKVQKAQEQAKQTLVDWILVLSLLNQGHILAENAYGTANNDIEFAERARRKATAAAAALLLATQKHNQENSRNSISRNTDSDSGGGFGGFGGGSFGGGGAGGSW